MLIRLNDLRSNEPFLQNTDMISRAVILNLDNSRIYLRGKKHSTICDVRESLGEIERLIEKAKGESNG